MAAIKCHQLLLARKLQGSGFVKVASEYEALAKGLLFWVLRQLQHRRDPTGVFLLPSLHHFSPGLVPVDFEAGETWWERLASRLCRKPAGGHSFHGLACT
jgi:hypothetical protein